MPARCTRCCSIAYSCDQLTVAHSMHAALKTQGIYENTLIVVTSVRLSTWMAHHLPASAAIPIAARLTPPGRQKDNGGPAGQLCSGHAGNNWPLRGGKTNVKISAIQHVAAFHLSVSFKFLSCVSELRRRCARLRIRRGWIPSHRRPRLVPHWLHPRSRLVRPSPHPPSSGTRMSTMSPRR